MKKAPNTFTEGLLHHYKQPLAHLSAIFLKLSILSMVDEKVSSNTMAPLLEEGEKLVQHMGMVLQEGELLKHTPIMNSLIDWEDLFADLSQTTDMTYDSSLVNIICSSHPLIFPHVMKALLFHHTHALTSQGKITITHNIENNLLTMSILRDQNLWDERSVKKVFFPFFDLAVPAPHWDLSIVSNLVSNQLKGEITAILTHDACGFVLTLPLKL